LASILDIERNNRKADFNQIHKEVERTELGIRAICIMYDEHSSDPNSQENIFQQKENIYYKLSSIRFQYRIILEQIYRAEEYIKKVDSADRLRGFVMGNPHFEKVEIEISSVFDNIVFNSVSIFDYLSHMICYVCKGNKQKTEYWSSLIKSARGDKNEIAKQQISVMIKHVDKQFVCKLNDYRSRLIHRKRDLHKFHGNIESNDSQQIYHIRLLASDELLSKKYLEIIKIDNPDYQYISLTYVASWLIKETMQRIEQLLEGLVFTIKDNSHYLDNLLKSKPGKGFMSGHMNPMTMRMIKISDTMWQDYKGIDNKWLFTNPEENAV